MNQDQNYVPRSAREQTQKLKKIIIITFCVMLAFVLLYFAYSTILSQAIDETLSGYFPWYDDLKNWANGGAGNEYQGNDFTIIFYPIDYEHNIMKDKEYLELDRKIYYFADRSQLGSMIELDDSNRDKQAVGVTLICDMVQSIIMGDADTYNSFFSDYYFEHMSLSARTLAAMLI